MSLASLCLLAGGGVWAYLFWMRSLPAKILVCSVAAIVLGGLGGLVTSSSLPGWYAGLQRPPGTPPGWVFGPVWTVLYAMMGSALALVWHRSSPGRRRRIALGWFATQFALNLAWSPVFFGAHRIGVALLVIVLLLVAVVLTIVRFRGIDRTAALMLAPYFAWVCYATYLNAGFLVANR